MSALKAGSGQDLRLDTRHHLRLEVDKIRDWSHHWTRDIILGWRWIGSETGDSHDLRHEG
jgi:hypothetical protein